MRKSVVDDLESISTRHRELFPKPVISSIPKERKFKEPRNKLRPSIFSDNKQHIIIIYKNAQYAYDGGGWCEIETE